MVDLAGETGFIEEHLTVVRAVSRVLESAGEHQLNGHIAPSEWILRAIHLTARTLAQLVHNLVLADIFHRSPRLPDGVALTGSFTPTVAQHD